MEKHWACKWSLLHLFESLSSNPVVLLCANISAFVKPVPAPDKSNSPLLQKGKGTRHTQHGSPCISKISSWLSYTLYATLDGALFLEIDLLLPTVTCSWDCPGLKTLVRKEKETACKVKRRVRHRERHPHTSVFSIYLHTVLLSPTQPQTHSHTDTFTTSLSSTSLLLFLLHPSIPDWQQKKTLIASNLGQKLLWKADVSV